MEEMDDILGGAAEAPVEQEPEQETPVEQETATGEEEATGETTRVAAEDTDTQSSAASVKAELAALARERERIRQKEAALDEERQRLAATTTATETTREVKETKDPQAELKDLRKQHREALAQSLLDPGDAEAARKVEDLEDRMEEVRLSVMTGATRAMSAQEKATADFNTVFSTVHDEFPFLRVDHPDVNAELNEDINAYYEGRKQKGDPPAVALRKAVDKFAPAYAKGLATNSGTTDAEAATAAAEAAKKKEAADKLVRDKLGKGGFSEVRSAGRTQATKPFTGPTPMANILGKST